MRNAATIQSSPLDSSPLARGALAMVRIGIALMWIQNAGWKNPPSFGSVDGGLYKWANNAVEYPVFPPFSWFVETIFLPGIGFFGWIILFVEVGLGAFLLVGLATRLWALIGVAQSIVVALSVLNTPHEWHWAYYLMVLGHLALFATAAGRFVGLDGVLRPIWLRSPHRTAKLLVVVS